MQLDGVLLERGDRRYEDARTGAIWNARKPPRYPEAIVIATTEQDVAAAVAIAKDRDLTISIRSGGHSWIANGVRDGGLLVDLSALNAVTVDREARIFTAQPATRGRDILPILGDQGLTFPVGHAPSVGIGGFSLGGGYGYNSRALGPACLNIEAVDVVLASGDLVHVSDESHPDLMWAARGAGPGFFGIVTKFYLRAHPDYARVLLSVATFPQSVRDELLVWSYEDLPDWPKELETAVIVSYEGGSDQITTLSAVAFCEAGMGEEVLEPITNCPFVEHALSRLNAHETSIAELQAQLDLRTPEGLRYAVDGIWCDAPGSEIVARSAEILNGVPKDESFLLWMLWGNYTTQENACWSSQAPLYLSPSAGWSDAKDDLEHERWVHEMLGDLQDMSRGTQFSDANSGDRPDAGLSDAHAQRLEGLRSIYDPEHRFASYLTPGQSATALDAYRRGLSG